MKKRGAVSLHFSIIAIFLIGIALGFFVGQSFKSKNAVSQAAFLQLQAENAALKQQIESAKRFFPSVNEMLSISGKITSISGNEITIETAASSNPFEESPKTRTVIVSSSTKILSRKYKTPSEMQAEIEKSISSSNALPPSPFSESEIKLSDLKVGDMILVSSETNVKTAARFTAKTITIEPTASSVLPVTPTAAPTSAPASSLPVSEPPKGAPPPPAS